MQAGKSFAKCSRRKTKSWKRLRAWGVVLEKIGRLVYTHIVYELHQESGRFEPDLGSYEIGHIHVLGAIKLLDRILYDSYQVSLPFWFIWRRAFIVMMHEPGLAWSYRLFLCVLRITGIIAVCRRRRLPCYAIEYVLGLHLF